ncbi:ABC transporter substrate-binding protein [Lactonifactor longoviformis]|uniref:Putative multiple sugar transport system substrate-binding protein n=1 Tax=Lactonifactor longoviformis DSM 17459 TaxID=1122155 RepID=A0A1M4TVU5_9CLOT|nr:multiple monosaccharide ABC transporter substrate-binding protein [Lactonifactor longoviformis]POP34429.1 ABC transporter substrate-binding protein [Lactonifactor longoviformis]SHE48581.1 putative multiple sugar transport system substrate-binding protein [Lactonifactor longoviformis DSM 17459]
MKKLAAVLAASVLCLSMFAGCGDTKEEASTSASDAKEADSESSGEKSEGGMVGVSMPTQSLQRWNQDGENLNKFLTEMGYEVDLQYADNEVQQQVSQIENMITKGAKVLIIAPVDGSALSAVLAEAHDAGIKVIAHDRFITETEDVDCVGTFDNNKVGALQGQYIADALDLEHADGPFNLEIVAGSLDDDNASYFLGGAMEILQPYIDRGKLVVRSGQTTREQCATDAWQTDVAQARMDNILTAYYTTEKLDAVLCSNDSTALGAESALKSAGYGSGDLPFPVITGQDCDTANVKAIIAGEQSMSVFKDTRALAKQVASMAQAFMNGEEPEYNDTTTYNNGAKVVPAYALEPIVVTKDNYQEKLVDSGYYTEAELK